MTQNLIRTNQVAISTINVKNFGAVGDGSNDDTAGIQLALDAANTAGGGIVFIPAGTYKITNTLLVYSDTHVYGAGRGATILTSPVSSYAGKSVEGAQVYATLAMAAVNRASVRNLTVDHSAGASANGIVIIAGNAGAGTRSNDCVIDGCEVIFSSSSGHAYCIWNLKSDGSKILNNYVEGGFTAYTWTAGNPQEGIESYGGEDVLISGNTVNGVQQNGIYVVSDSTVGTVQNICVVDNSVESSGRGVTLVIGNCNGIQVKNNHIKTAWDIGISLTANATSTVDGVHISGNTITDVGDADPHSVGVGVYLYGDLSATISRIVISDNIIKNCQEATTAAIANYSFSNTQIINNNIKTCTGFGILAYNPNDLVIDGNTIDGTQDSSITVGTGGAGNTPTRIRVTNNHCRNYNGDTIGHAAIWMSPATKSYVEGNTFYTANTTSNLVYAAGATCDHVYIGSNNIPLFAYTGSQPLRNDGTNANRGSYSAAAAEASKTINTTLFHRHSTISVEQTGGTARPFTIQRYDSGFIITYFAAAVGDETFIWTLS